MKRLGVADLSSSGSRDEAGEQYAYGVDGTSAKQE